ncbi:hypothetical protein [Legionella septentrionalis]|uniref:hypothetical protein n=1 Tax=Legionella septentrionalis TaxID=2498109 RepID=UPI000F8CEBFC|nr:hypothetical protein [Legionella septentrionalis]RUQ96637.1 hypothetical protein ELY11_07410 [Legionella septentrionalis]
MGNLCSIFHEKHDNLRNIAGSPAKAEFLSKCILWWQISKYKIRGSDHIWFTRTQRQLAENTFLSESSIGRYLKEFSTKGLIEKRVVKRYSKEHKQEITCLHIRITEKLQFLLRQKDNHIVAKEAESIIEPESNFLNQIDDSGSVNLTIPSINKDKKNNHINNTVSQNNSVNSEEKKSFQKIKFKIEKEIGERITEELKDKIKGMLFNLEYKQGVRLFDKERLFAEIVFSIMNEPQLKNISCTKHRLNIIAKKIKSRQWATPKGFYNHSDIGQIFKFRDLKRAEKIENEKKYLLLSGVECSKKQIEILNRLQPHCFTQETTGTKIDTSKSNLISELKKIEFEILSDGRLLQELEKHSKGEGTLVHQNSIIVIKTKLEALYQKQKDLEMRVGGMQNFTEYCAG